VARETPEAGGAPAALPAPAAAQPQASPAMPVEKLLADSVETYMVVKGDAISKIASRYRITSGLVRRLNGMPEDHQLIHVDERLKVVSGPFKVVVDTTSMQLALYRGEKLVKTYPVGVGTDETDTPKGSFKVIDKVKNARWDYGGMHVPPGSPENPTGTRWMKIAPSYGIHGTNDPSSIGKKTSRGCIRMFNADAEELYDIVTIGSEVIVK
jgi:lipoprotein-anchoring transpeptidase ErfK/SrfK